MLQAPPEEDGVWPENAEAIQAFLAVAQQWRCIPRMDAAPLWLGLDYTAAEAGLRMAGVDVTPPLWEQVRLIEAGAAGALNEER
ncbi:DUF1799 domain-containing protein [Citreimonas salinaria]|uniref:Uncharacterized protein n=1 Tax=Citreimonas salinaria TaxID=321339 RepID=A0A1H3KTZ1_9RHOB|nr:DUF1799 domain-containing protein [Citreimonas salinaria]SDY55486.1 Phage related hypothetical protein [Citreimonas salinaria]